MPPPVKSVVIGTAGHIDHGKTALVRALTGIDADRLPEEKRRGITIDLGFAFLDATSTDGTPIRISFVDVPGHSLFIRNMLAGASCISAVLLVVSAQEGIKPQTIEHLAICRLLGITRGITVITKTDAVSPSRLAEVHLEIGEFLRGTFLDPARSEILSVSAVTRQGIEELRRRLVMLGEGWDESRIDHLSRLPIDRAFVMKGFGTVVTGTLLSGVFRTGQSLALQPGGRVVRVRGMQTHGRAQDLVVAGTRVALNLADIEVSEVSRGQTLVAPETLTDVTTIDVEVEMLPGSSALKHRSRVHFHAFTSDTLASVSLYGYDKVEAGTTRLLRIKLQAPIPLVAGDRFVLRQVSPVATIGGGRVLDAHPLPQLRKAQSMAWLESLRSASIEEQLRLRVARRGTHGLAIGSLMTETGLSRKAVERLSIPLMAGHRLLLIASNILLASEAFDAAAKSIIAGLKHDRNLGGIKRSELKSQTALSAEVFDFVLEHLAEGQKIRTQGELVCSAETGARPINRDAELLSTIAAIYRKAGLAAPLTSEVAAMLTLKGEEMRRLTTLLFRDKILIRMDGETLFIHHQALERLQAEIRALRGQSLDIARFKQMTGLSRKYAIPLLEYLDRERITRKTGERRLIL
jgi:selenocysteine-specific elongation factor